MTPRPPERAMAMAILDSVTRSIAAEIKGEAKRISREKTADTSTASGRVELNAGTMTTSSKVYAWVVVKIDSLDSRAVVAVMT